MLRCCLTTPHCASLLPHCAASLLPHCAAFLISLCFRDCASVVLRPYAASLYCHREVKNRPSARKQSSSSLINSPVDLSPVDRNGDLALSHIALIETACFFPSLVFLTFQVSLSVVLHCNSALMSVLLLPHKSLLDLIYAQMRQDKL